MRTWFVWPVLILALSITPVYADSDVFPHYLRCEYKVDPLGIDVMQPRLTWEVGAKDPAMRGLAQSGYQIVVASSLSQLAENQGDLWDTGQVDSSQSANIVYQGAPLKANMDCFWKVRVWDQNGDVSKWSRPARWSMGLLEKSDWEAQWIQEPLRDDFDLCKWIWFPAGNPKQQAPKETVYFRKTFEIPYVADEALVVMAADDAYTLYLDGKEVISSAAGPDAWDHPQYKSRVRVGSGKHVLAVKAVNETEGPAGLAGKFMVVYNHTQLVLPTDGSWKVSKQAQAGWMDPSFNDSSWQQAKVLSHVGMNDNPWGVPGDSDNLILSPPPYFAKDVEIQKPVKRAMLYATAHGMFDLFMNGEKVGDAFFRPGWSDYRFRLYYNTYDVTADLQQGQATLGAYLADGWYSGYIGWGRKRNHYEGQTKIKIQLNVEYEDGSQEVFGTDETWNVMASPPIREADFLHGEMFDARKAKDGKIARQAVLAHDQQDEGLALDAYPGVNVKAIEELPAKKVSEPKPGVYVFDLGQNMVGLARLKVQGPKGTKVQMRFAERLNEDGTLYTANLRTARVLDTYILSGEG
ncbi:Bacterial alpha-L-rhamnosidase, partial [bacterium]|nr:Bacterial alpha-L-rhamnosidase [bacterium]